jgi:hypothetical protein
MERPLSDYTPTLVIYGFLLIMCWSIIAKIMWDRHQNKIRKYISKFFGHSSG